MSSSSALNERPVASVVIPTRDRWALLATTLASALAQVDVEVEIVIVDDGSSSRMPGGPPWDDPRVRVVRHGASLGVAAARNAGIDAASGDWVAFLDDDDLWAPAKLRDQLAAAEGAGGAFAYSRVVAFSAEAGPLGLRPPPDPATLARLLRSMNAIPAGASNVVVRAEVLDRVGGFDTRFSHSADWDMWIRLAAAGPAASCQAAHVGYRQHPGSMRATAGGAYRELRALDRKHRHGIVATPDRLWVHRWLVEGHVLAGRRAAAVGSQVRAAVLCRSPRELARLPHVLRAGAGAAPGTAPPADDDRVRWLQEYVGPARASS